MKIRSRAISRRLAFGVPAAHRSTRRAATILLVDNHLEGPRLFTNLFRYE